MLGEEDGIVLRTYANGVLVASQNDQIILMSAAAPFGGKTAAGLGLGALPKDLIALYGRPATGLSMSLGDAWVYPSRGISFVLRDGKVVSWIVFKPV